MSIATAITNAQNKVAAAYSSVNTMGGTLPATQNLSNLPTAIESIPSGGSAPVITSLNVTPTTSSQTITAPSGTDGYSPVNVAAVTASIDSDIKASNIKSGVSILGVTGTVTELNGETRTATLTSSAGNTFTPSSGKNAITSITVTPNNQARSVTPSTSAQTLSVNSGYSGNGTISVSAVTSSIDANIQAGNIKKDVQILGVTGTLQTSEILFTSIIEDVGVADYEYDIPNKTFTIKLPEIVQGLSALALSYAFDGWKSNLVIDFPHITYMRNNAMEYAFRNSGLSSISIPNLVNLIGSRAMLYAFQNCTALTEFNLQNLSSVSGAYACRQMLNGCSGLVSVTFYSLEQISGNQAFSYTFANCSSGITIYFPKLILFGSYTNQFNMMLSGVKNATVHFRSDIKNEIKNWSDVLSGFGGKNTTILFDL